MARIFRIELSMCTGDSAAAIVGAVLSALHGESAIPSRWVERLSDRTTDRDDGSVSMLLEQTRMLLAQ